MLQPVWLIPQNFAVLLPLSGHFHCYTTITKVFQTQTNITRYFTPQHIHLLVM